MLCVATDPLFSEHDPGVGHPERPERIEAVTAALAPVAEATIPLPARDAPREALLRVHGRGYLDALRATCERGGGVLDPDTVVSERSWAAAVRAAGAGLAAIDALSAGEADAAFCAVRPPGHHASGSRAMGFCLLNNVAIAAAELTARGERVLVVDWDAHHGNGTQDAFYADARVLYVSLHEWPLYPGTGALDETGTGSGEGLTCNLPLPAGATGDVFAAALDEVVAPLAERFDPTWVLVSAGYDAHRADPLTGLALSSGDFADLAARVRGLAPGPGRVICFLEGGYDLRALRDSVTATVTALIGEPVRPETATAGGPGHVVVTAAADLHGVGAR